MVHKALMQDGYEIQLNKNNIFSVVIFTFLLLITFLFSCYM